MVVAVRSSMTAGALNPLLSGGGRWPEARVTARFHCPIGAGRGTILHKTPKNHPASSMSA